MDLLDRLYRKLLDALGRDFPGEPAPGCSIAELHQRLIPYRAMRGELGLLELAEYEHALLRLLAGERGYLAVETPEVSEELRRELASPNPILGIYRDYAEARVTLVPAAGASPDPPRSPSPPPARPEPTTRGVPGASLCHRCRISLPDVPDVRFCPACGADQMVSCAGCGLQLKPEWNFCVRCGRPRQGRGIPA